MIEVEKPKIKLFNKAGKPSAEFNSAIEQVKSWQRYFSEKPLEKSRIFGAVAKFMFMLIAEVKGDWEQEDARKWRKYHDETSDIEIRSFNVFIRSLESMKNHPHDFWSLEENPISLSHSQLKDYWTNYDYMG